MEVDIQIQGAAETLYQGYSPGLGGGAGTPGLLDEMGLDGPVDEAEHSAHDLGPGNCGALRLAIFLVWKNYVRGKRVRRWRQTPAMLVGVCGRRLTVREIVGRRLFWAQIGLEGRWRQYYWGEVVTRALKVNRRHDLKYAA